VGQETLEFTKGKLIGAIGPGLLVLVCAEQGDTPAQADKLLAKILKLRIFSDAQGKMNRCVQDLDGAGLHGGEVVAIGTPALIAASIRRSGPQT
jgi:D-Tyr-tRNAtyr deacylase